VSAYSLGLMGFRTPNIDRIAREGMIFMDYYGEQSCTAGRAAFITGQSVFRTGNSKVGLPGAPQGLQKEDPTLAELLKPLGYATGQFGKNHLGDRNEFLPTVHGFDEFYGNLYHLNAEEEPELPDYPSATDFPNFRQRSGRAACCTALPAMWTTRRLIHASAAWANKKGKEISPIQLANTCRRSPRCRSITTDDTQAIRVTRPPR
jgi:arylsulfatase A-like enzyme